MADKYYYNGVLLPEIPADVLAEYPYAWIRLSGDGTKYQLFVSPSKWFLVDENTGLQGATPQWYDASAESDSFELFTEYSNTRNVGLAGGLIWSNHDIPKGSAASTVIYFNGSEPVGPNTPDDDTQTEVYYRISGERLKGFADQARRLGKISGELTPAQIEEVLRGVTAGAALPSIHPLLIAVDVKPTILPKFAVNDINIVVDASPDVFATVEDVTPPATLSGPKCYYNDVLLPGIPAEMLARYPYAWIRTNLTSGYYDLLFSNTPFYYKSSPGIYEGNGKSGLPWYRVSITDAESATNWTDNTTENTYKWWGLDTERTVLWSNHDIPNGSADATEIYFEGSEPVPAE